MSLFQQQILAKKAALAESVGAPLSRLAERLAPVWEDADALDALLEEAIGAIAHCHLLYCWDVDGIAVSSMVEPGRLSRGWRGRDLSARPYLKNHLPFRGVMLSSVYESLFSRKPCITALQAVVRDGRLLGFVAADFALADLLADVRLAAPELAWQQFRGDPAVRGTVFLQSRAPSRLDAELDAVLARIERVMAEHGVFHTLTHFSSSRSIFWLYDDPYRYRLHDADDLLNPDFLLIYPPRACPREATVTRSQLHEVMRVFKELRLADETIYLRSGSINVINGLVGLTFSCDGSHYMSVAEFLDRDVGFWTGTA